MSATCEEIICCPPKIGEYLAGGGGMRQERVLYNVDFGDTVPTAKTGYAAVGIVAEDFWNAFGSLSGTTMALKDSTGQLHGVTMGVSGALGWFFDVNGNTDPMVDSFGQNITGSDTPVQVNNLEAGTYDLYVYGWSNNAGTTGGIPAAAGEFFVTVNGVQYPVSGNRMFTLTNANPPPWTRAGNFARIGQIPVAAGQALIISVRGGVGARPPKISGFQLIRSPAPEQPGPGRGEVTPAINTGVPSYFVNGENFIAGRYRMTYLHGAMKYSAAFSGYSIDSAFTSAGYKITHSGGVITTGPWSTDQATQAIVEELFAGAYVDFDHTGGTIAIGLVDTIYDNVPGSPNPTFALSRLS